VGSYYPVGIYRMLMYECSYAKELEQEAAHESSQSAKPPQEWPSRGELELKDVFMCVSHGE